MNRFLFILFFSVISFSALSQNYKPVDEGSKLHFVIKNFGINTGGDLSGLKGNITFTPGNVANCHFNVSVDVKTIDTDNESRDHHLKSEDYFDAEKYPLITIKSTKIDKTNKVNAGWYYFTGTLTMRGVTKTISFPFTATPQNGGYLFKSVFDVNRLDYGVGKSSGVMSKTAKVSLSVLARKS